MIEVAIVASTRLLGSCAEFGEEPDDGGDIGQAGLYKSLTFIDISIGGEIKSFLTAILRCFFADSSLRAEDVGEILWLCLQPFEGVVAVTGECGLVGGECWLAFNGI